MDNTEMQLSHDLFKECRVLMDMTNVQEDQHTIIMENPIEHLIREIAQDYKTDPRFQSWLMAQKEAMEAQLVGLFEEPNLRVTIMPENITEESA